jgi:hypothetical protein
MHGRVYERWRVQVRARIDISMRDSLYVRMYVRKRVCIPVCVHLRMRGCAHTG